FLGPVRGRDAPSEVRQSLIGDVDVERTNLGRGATHDDLRSWKMRFRMTSSRVVDQRDPTPTGGAKQQVFSSDRKRFIVLQVKTMSALHRAAGTRQWKSRLSSSGRCSRRDGGAPRPSSRRPRRPLDPALQWSRSGWLPYLGSVTILLLTGPSRASA